jgi:hypothetical protein
MKYLPYILIAILCCLVTYCSTEYFRLPCPEIVKSDTVTLIDTVFLQEDVIKKPYTPAISGIIYKDSVKSADSIIKIPAAYIYKDSLIDENLGIYITDTTAGKILGRGIRYNLKVPLKITETKTITNTIESSCCRFVCRIRSGFTFKDSSRSRIHFKKRNGLFLQLRSNK